MIKLNLGCGSDIKPGYCNIDVRHIPGINLVQDVTDLKNFDDNTVDEILAKDVLEHFPRIRTAPVLHEWKRVLKSGGLLRLCFPNLKRIAERYLGINCDNDKQHKLDANFTAYLLYGGQDYPENFHMAGWDAESITELLQQIGFVDITCASDGGSNLLVSARKP